MYAQDEQPTMFVVHVDNVNFNKIAQYEQLAKELKENCEKHNVQGVDWTAMSTEDARYYYVSPIKNMAELDENPMGELFEKMGEEEAGALFDKMDECYDSHGNSIVHYLPKLSYNPAAQGFDCRSMSKVNEAYVMGSRSRLSSRTCPLPATRNGCFAAAGA